MGGQVTHVPKQIPEQNNQVPQKIQHQIDNNVRQRQQGLNKDYRFERKRSLVIKQLQKFQLHQQQRYKCDKRIKLISQAIYRYDQKLQNDNNFENNIDLMSQAYLQNSIFPLIQKHQQTCFECTGRHWQVQQWKYQKDQQVKVEQQINKYKRLTFKIRKPGCKTDSLQVIIYKYLKLGDGFLKNDKVRNMKIYKFPLSQLQLTNLIFQHQYLVVECENSYWSFEKDTKKLIIQSSVLLSDVRDKCLGQSRTKEMSFKWFGLRQKWHPEVMYQSNQFSIQNIKEVRVFAQHFQQISLKYNVFTANCKVYAQYIMKNCLTQKSWNSIQTFFDFFHS